MNHDLQLSTENVNSSERNKAEGGTYNFLSPTLPLHSFLPYDCLSHMHAFSIGTQRVSALDLKDLRESGSPDSLMASEVTNTRAMAPKESIEIYSEIIKLDLSYIRKFVLLYFLGQTFLEYFFESEISAIF